MTNDNQTPEVFIPDFLTSLKQFEHPNASLYDNVNGTPVIGAVPYLIALFEPVRELLKLFEIRDPQIDTAYSDYAKSQIALSLLAQFSNVFSEDGFNKFLKEMEIESDQHMVEAALSLYDKSPLNISKHGSFDNGIILADFFEPLKNKFELRDLKANPQIKAPGYEFAQGSFIFSQWTMLIHYQINQLVRYLDDQGLQMLVFKHPRLLDDLKHICVYYYKNDEHTLYTMDMLVLYLAESLATLDIDDDLVMSIS